MSAVRCYFSRETLFSERFPSILAALQSSDIPGADALFSAPTAVKSGDVSCYETPAGRFTFRISTALPANVMLINGRFPGVYLAVALETGSSLIFLPKHLLESLWFISSGQLMSG